jgi:hypothetical protein
VNEANPAASIPSESEPGCVAIDSDSDSDHFRSFHGRFPPERLEFQKRFGV